ncbi:Rho GTPase activating protein with PAK-box/P21-Rho-binding domain-containing protein [Perilla frutescens var. hirtella]|uniref:Rho GTPase activating protein with PAK-box/P21-Rho-binding domain-containing protein n=1 Tax=Perilla frutescens var. hirtella TaxID=608512 RepID=A0AAD4J5R8_PERFH|nr:Rho GTPase activating protein with PAK-box/P21-Rho-binding domain-containing protein [Perilla frutescens var. hirtella]KAH6827602.1 Rho GTPase activating protein with PAK-box/P21-Rho-binding domain-containing protein [Perilla frutescens var. hirtella]
MSGVVTSVGCGGKSSKSGAGEDQEKQLSFLDLILSALPTCRIDEQDEEVISAVHDIEIGWPTNVQHLTHVTFDRFHGFLGLPVEFELEIPCKAPGASVSVCGVSADSMKWSYDARCNSVPTILLLMQEKLYALGGLKAEGIFRINPENSEEGYVRKHLSRGIVPDEIDVHCLAGLIKAWFRELPSGVLDGLSPEQVLQCDAEEDCVELVEQLRPTESCLLSWAVDLMADVAELEESNKMSARNIAMVFAPNMTKMSDPLTALMHAVQVTNLLETLITRRIRERGEAVPVSPRFSDRKKHKKYDDHGVMASDDEGIHQYSPISEDRYESDSLSDIEYCFSRQHDEQENAKDGFRKQLERILCRDQSSPINGSTLHTDSGVSFLYSQIGSSSTSTSDDEASRSRSRSRSRSKNSRFDLH